MKKIYLLVFISLAQHFCFSQSIDPTFNAKVTTKSKAVGSILMNDGRYLLWGEFKSANGSSVSGIVRYNADGTLDNSFAIGEGAIGSIRSAVMQADGKIIIAGRFIRFNGADVKSIVRLNSNGSLDNTFQASVEFSSAGANIKVGLQSDGKVILVGPISKAGTQNLNEDIIRLNANGSYDATFNAPGFNGSIEALGIQADNKLIVGGVFTSIDGAAKGRIARLNANGSLDNTFDAGTGFNSLVTDIAVVSASRILVSGFFTSFNDGANNYLVALTGTGALDNNFALNGKPNAAVYSIRKQGDGKVVLAGSFSSINGVSKNRLCRFNTDFSFDNTLVTGTGPNGYLEFAATNAGNDILVLGSPSSFTTFNGQARTGMAIVTSAGTLKAMTEPLSLQEPVRVLSLARYGADKILLSHQGSAVNGVSSSGFTRLNGDGTLDAAFNTLVSTIDQVNPILVDKNNQIVVGGNFTTVGGVSCNRIARFDGNGNVDVTFRTNIGTGFNGSITALAEQPDGKLIIGGGFTSFNGNTIRYLARLNANGTFDNTFNVSNGFLSNTQFDGIRAIEVLPDGKILVGGGFNSFDNNTVRSLIRLNANGSFDNTFAIGTGITQSNGSPGTVYSLLRLDDGKLLVAGFFDRVNDQTVRYYGRLNSDGSFDRHFNEYSFFIIEKLEMLPNGKILLLERSRLSRMNADGTIDDTFNQMNFGNWMEDVMFIGDDIVAGGVITTAGTINQAGLTKVTIPAAPAAPTVLNGNAASATQVSLSWQDNANNEGGFKIERSLTSNANFAVIGKVGANVVTYNDNSASPSTTYYYRVNAFNAGGLSGYSNVKSVTTPESIPLAPTGLQVSVLDGTTLRLTWNDQSNNEQNFIVRRSTDNANFATVATLGANTTAYENTGLTVGTRYYYRVTAKNTAGESSILTGSAIAGFYAMAAGNFSVCDGVYYDPGGQSNYSKNQDVTTTLTPSTPGASMVLDFQSFQTVSGFDALTIYDGSDINAPAIGTFSGSNSPGKVVASNVNGTLTLRFTSSAFDPLSGWVAKMSCIMVPARPTNFSLSVVHTNLLKLSWTDNSTIETGFQIERSVGGTSSFVTLATVGANATEYNDNTVEKDVTYYYRLRALGATDHSTFTPLTGVAFGDGGVWILKADLNGLARTDAVAFGVGGKGYLGTGITGTYALDMRVLDVENNAWSTAQGYGGSIRAEAVSFVINGKAFVGTGEGFNREKDLWEYNPATNTWAQKADFPGTARTNAVAFAAGNVGYVGTGTDGALKKDFYAYNPSTNTWTAIVDFPGVARQGAVAFSLNGEGYVGTGTGASGRLKDFWKYTPATNTWTRIADFPGLARKEAVAFVIGNKAYVGTGDSGKDEKDFYAYDPSANTWTKIVSFGGTARFAATAFEVGEKGFVATGFDGGNRKDVWQFTSSTVPVAPATPSNVIATTLSSTQIELSWTDNANNETGYSIERSTGNENAYSEIAVLPPNSVSYNNTGLTADTKYFYRLRALHSTIGHSKYSTAVNATTLPLPPAAPSGVNASALSFSQIALTWTDNSGTESEFVIERSLSAGSGFSQVAIVPANTTSYTNAGLNGSTTYFYRIFAKNSGGSSAFSNVASATTPVTPVLAPSGLTAQPLTANKIVLQWIDNSNNETGFLIERSPDNIAWSQIDTAPANSVQFENTALTENTLYYYRVSAKTETNTSAASNVASATTPKSVPLDPTSLLLTYDENLAVIALQWTDNSFNEEAFVIERASNGAAFVEIGSATGNTYTDDNVGDAYTVSYRVYAINWGGRSGFSNVASHVITDVLSETLEPSVKLWPNPASEALSISLESATRGTVVIEIYSMSGVKIGDYRFEKTDFSFVGKIDMVSFPKGVMAVSISHNDTLTIRKVVIR